MHVVPPQSAANAAFQVEVREKINAEKAVGRLSCRRAEYTTTAQWRSVEIVFCRTPTSSIVLLAVVCNRRGRSLVDVYDIYVYIPTAPNGTYTSVQSGTTHATGNVRNRQQATDNFYYY